MDAPRFQLCMAPLRGLTGALFRNTYSEFFHGIDWAVTPFLSTTQGSRIKPSQLQDVLPENNTRMPVVPQVIGNRPEKFITLSKALFDLGYETVNWNLGCPFPRVAKKQRGSGLLPYPDIVDAFLEAVIPKIPNRISIKLRLGRHDPEEIFALLPVLNGYPVQELFLHPRTGVQMYTGTVDLNSFEACLALSRCPVIYNGDIVSRDTFESLKDRFPSVGTWMIGRGLLQNPFLPAEIKGLLTDPIERVNRFREFHDTLFDRLSVVRQGPAHLVDAMKGYWGYFHHFFADGGNVLKTIRKIQRPEHYRDFLKRFFDHQAKWCGDPA